MKQYSVNWEEQWSLFAEGFRDGKAHIQLGEKTLLLKPGPGFGDLSHPTTALMLEMMRDLIVGESVLDIGTGSGILALSALLIGAKSAVGIDIDPLALQHAKENAKLNGLKARFSKSLPKTISEKSICFMNMILPEQVEFAPQRLNPLAKVWVISGILKEQRELYLALAHKWGWVLVSERQKGEWLGFLFQVG